MFAADPEMKDAAVRRFIRRIEPGKYRTPVRTCVKPTWQVRVCPNAATTTNASPSACTPKLRANRPFPSPICRFRAADVVAALIRRGEAARDFRGDQRVGEALRWLFEQVTDAPDCNERSALLALLEQYLDTQTRNGTACRLLREERYWRASSLSSIKRAESAKAPPP